MCGAKFKSGMAADELAGNLEKEPLCLVESEKVSCYYFRQVGILINSLWQPKAVVAIISLILSKRLLLIILKCKRERCLFTILKALVVRYLELLEELRGCHRNCDLN